MATFLIAVAIIDAVLASRECKAIYQEGAFDEVALFPLDVCLLYHDNGIDGSTTLACNATGHKVLRKWHSSTVCADNYDEESFYDVGDSVECTGNDCPYAVLRRYNSYQCTTEYDDFVDLPVLIHDCVQNGGNSWIQYECNRTVIKVVQYGNNACVGQGINNVGFIDGTCENDGYHYDEIPYCASETPQPTTSSPTTPEPTTSPTTAQPTVSPTTSNPTAPSVSPTTAEPTTPTTSPTRKPTDDTETPTSDTGSPTSNPTLPPTLIPDDIGGMGTSVFTFSMMVNVFMVVGIIAME